MISRSPVLRDEEAPHDPWLKDCRTPHAQGLSTVTALQRRGVESKWFPARNASDDQSQTGWFATACGKQQDRAVRLIIRARSLTGKVQQHRAAYSLLCRTLYTQVFSRHIATPAAKASFLKIAPIATC